MNRQGKIIPILTILTLIVAIWYACVVWMNAPFEYDKAERISKASPRIERTDPGHDGTGKTGTTCTSSSLQ